MMTELERILMKKDELNNEEVKELIKATIQRLKESFDAISHITAQKQINFKADKKLRKRMIDIGNMILELEQIEEQLS